MQFKNIIFSAALLAMVSAAPIDNVPNTDAVHKDATGAATDSTAAAPPTKDVAVPEFNYKNCADAYNQLTEGSSAPHDPTGQHEVFMNKCESCYMHYFHETNESHLYNLTKESPEYQYVENTFEQCKRDLTTRDTVTGLPTTVEAPKTEAPKAEAPKADPKVEVPKGVNANDVTNTAETPSVDAAKNPVKVPEVKAPSTA